MMMMMMMMMVGKIQEEILEKVSQKEIIETKGGSRMERSDYTRTHMFDKHVSASPVAAGLHRLNPFSPTLF